jgi:hypothetical protein
LEWRPAGLPAVAGASEMPPRLNRQIASRGPDVLSGDVVRVGDARPP